MSGVTRRSFDFVRLERKRSHNSHRIKKLIEVKFQEIVSQKLNGQKIGEKVCPSCSKTMSNATLCISKSLECAF